MNIEISFPVGLCIALILADQLGGWGLSWYWLFAPVWLPVATLVVISPVAEILNGLSDPS